MQKNPILSKLFLLGQAVSAPFPPGASGKGGAARHAHSFVGKRYPEYFRFKDRKNGEGLRRATQLGRRARVTFETDAEDADFVRDHEPGAWNVRRKVGGKWVDAGGWSTTGPKSGIAHLTLDSLPAGTSAGDTIEYLIEVTDPVRFDAFAMELTLDVVPMGVGGGGGGGGPRPTPTAARATAEEPARALALPNITTVSQAGWRLTASMS